jgi:hypothetical protein
MICTDHKDIKLILKIDIEKLAMSGHILALHILQYKKYKDIWLEFPLP